MNNPRKVLLVENDASIRYMMRDIIATLGVEVSVAEDGQSCLDMLSSAPSDYGLVLMDLHMPQLSGIDAAKQIREAPVDPPSNIPIIAVTADAAFHDQAIVRKIGMDGFAPKPLTPSRLLRLIDKFCTAAELGNTHRQSTAEKKVF
ncbi:response regulator [Leisingera sp. SS27]|uniref:response regulator n=1 Tax=Leisingera sp. SS27 TaxID=2979462 RepID=UPI00232CD67F|nr:response regulator [Leisingera sp. SS27]MDC0660211.1 response regulator [Leisingera sp. SS27]